MYDITTLPPRVRQAMQPCFVAPSPELEERLQGELARIKSRSKNPLVQSLGIAREPRALGLNDGVIFPPEAFPFGTPDQVIRNAGADRAPLRGTVRVIVVLVDFSDNAMSATQQHFRDLFFSTGVIPTGSVKEYFSEVTGGLIDLAGDVVGPYRMPETQAWYANGNFGIGRPTGTARARDMAEHAFDASDPDVNFAPYDNDGNGFVDAFIVVHAGTGGEQSGNPNDIWSHKWVMSSPRMADTTQVFGYLTIPEDSRIGVCAHELGHLLFGFPDLYDTDGTSEGIGNWCLMAGGSWNGGGDTPAHPSAWCKVNQGWATVTNVTTNGTITVNDVKTSRQVFRLWKDGAGGSEYFLLENRQRTAYDSRLPSDGLLLWHIDDAKPTNTDENHYKVGLIQADGLRQLETKVNRGDAGDPFPGSAGVTAVSGTTTPNTKSYTGSDTCVSVTDIPASTASMTVRVSVRCLGKPAKEHLKDGKELFEKPDKDLWLDNKRRLKDLKENRKEFKDLKELKEFKEIKEIDIPGGWRGWPGGLGAAEAENPLGAVVSMLDQAVGLLRQLVGEPTGGAPAGTQPGADGPFIDQSLRPDLYGAGGYAVAGDLDKRLAEGDPSAKRELDSPPRR